VEGAENESPRPRKGEVRGKSLGVEERGGHIVGQ